MEVRREERKVIKREKGEGRDEGKWTEKDAMSTRQRITFHLKCFERAVFK